MTKQSTYTFEVDASPDRVLEVLSGPDFEVAQQAVQAGNQSCKYKEISRDERTLVYELHTVEYARGLTGIDESKTERSTTYVTWDLETRSSAWSYDGPHGKRATIGGSTAVSAKGSGSIVRTTFSISIKIPLVGSKIEKLVVRGTEKHWPVFERIAREQARES